MSSRDFERCDFCLIGVEILLIEVQGEPRTKLLSEAKGDENKRRLGARDLTRPWPKGPASSTCKILAY